MPPSADSALRHLCALHAVSFGERLLRRGCRGAITFPTFIAVAAEMIRALPEQSAVYLAALVALDMQRTDGPQPLRPAPSAN